MMKNDPLQRLRKSELLRRLRQQEQQSGLQQLQSEFERSRDKDQLIAMVSHELRTPLSSMLLWSRILQQKLRGQPEYLQAVDAIIRSAESQRKLVDDLLDMSRITSGKLRLSFQNIDLQPLVAIAIESLQPMASAKGVALQSDLDVAEAMVHGDSERLQQVFWNLILNGVKFTPPGGCVRVTARRIGDEADIRVTDSGQGIVPDLLPHVFEPFRQGEHAVTTRSHGGLGLGLAISRQLVVQHHGSIHAASEGAGLGATFVVRLPLAQGERKARSSSAAGTAPWGQNGELAGIRILVVEDETETRTALASMVTAAGASVIAVDSVVAALAAFQSVHPDIVVSDVGMPVQDGYQLIERVRALESSTGAEPVRALALTAFTGSTDRARALAAGFNEHLGKPIEPAQLFSTLCQMIRDRGVRSQAPPLSAQ
jgi:nitrogen-specific signal transduction histidine kinase/ActR/RegA family two-component response regulator